jgi:predicted Rossmann-fold nucleotide-binding protein
MQTGKVDPFPSIGMGSDFWLPLRAFLQQSLLKEKTISESDRELFTLTDSVEAAVATIEAGTEPDRMA